MVQKQSHVLSPYVSISSFWICSLLLGRCYQRSGYTLPGHEWAYPLTLHQNFLTHVVFMRILHCWFSTSLERLQNFVCRETCSMHTCAVLFVQKNVWLHYMPSMYLQMRSQIKTLSEHCRCADLMLSCWVVLLVGSTVKHCCQVQRKKMTCGW